MFGSRSKQSSKAAEPAIHIAQNLVDVGGDLSVPELLQAYRSGAFPWTVDPVTWWSPDPRAILELNELHVSRSLQKTLRKGTFTTTTDRAFRLVMEGCAEPAAGRRTTWITREFIDAYTELHVLGYAHSLEVWQGGELAGGIYGLALGGYFVGESMFHRVTDASKVALCHLVQHLKERGYQLFDVQMPTRVTMQMGVRLIPRRDFLRRLRAAIAEPILFSSVAGTPDRARTATTS